MDMDGSVMTVKEWVLGRGGRGLSGINGNGKNTVRQYDK